MKENVDRIIDSQEKYHNKAVHLEEELSTNEPLEDQESVEENSNLNEEIKTASETITAPIDENNPPSNDRVLESPEQVETPEFALKQGELLEDVFSNLKEIAATQNDIKKDFNQKLQYDQHKEQLIDKLHKELQEYKDDIIKSSIQPLVRDLIMINDNIFKLIENYRASDEPLQAEAILDQMEGITMDIDDALYRQGIETYTCPGEKVDPIRQNIFKTVKINDTSKEKHLSDRIRKGYEWDDKIIRKELVSVYIHDENIKETPDDAIEGVDTK